MKTAKAQWKALNLGVNFMTPEAFDFGFIGDDWVYELSEGRGFTDELIYGVSVREIGTGKRISEWSDLVLSRAAAQEMIELARESRKEGK